MLLLHNQQKRGLPVGNPQVRIYTKFSKHFVISAVYR
nr:MAG TPA: hypothetical protein [Caudoviricetes sp.]